MTQELNSKLQKYKRRFYINLLIRGLLISLSIVLGIYLIFNVLEFSFRFNSWLRATVFFSFVILSAFMLGKFVFLPLVKILIRKNQISNEEAAQQIGGFFPQVKDKLINILQLASYSDQNNSLVRASIQQKSKEIAIVNFSEAIDYKANYKYFRYFLPVSLLILVLLLVSPQLFTESTHRLIHYKQEFVPEAPFTFKLQNNSLQAFRSEDFIVNLALQGEVIPENVYINTGDRRIKLQNENGSYTYTFTKVQKSETFNFEAAGFYSQNYQLDLVNRPNIKNFTAFLSYPAYLKKTDERLSNIGNMQVPEGTIVQWEINTITADSVQMVFEKEKKQYTLNAEEDDLFSFEKSMLETDDYRIELKNKYSQNKDLIRYHVDVIPDQMPVISLEQFQDTIFYNYMILGGNIADDYGISDLKVFYKLEKEASDEEEFQSFDIKIDPEKNSQSYYYQWQLDSLQLTQGENLVYYLQVRDNDAINGRKAARTGIYNFKVPDKKELKEELERSAQSAREQIQKSLEQSKELNEDIDNAIDKMKSKKQMDWNDKKMIEDLVKKKEELEKEINRLQEQYKSDAKKRERFSPEQKKNIKEKVQQLQQMMDELLDEETKKLYEELKKLLEENKDINELQENLEQLNFKEENLEKELERSIELMKKLQFDHKLEEVRQEVEEMSEKQEELAKETNEKESEAQEMQQKQEEINQEYEENKKELDELQEMNQDMKNPKAIPDMEEEQKEIEQEQQNTKESLEKNKKKKASDSQQNMSQQMKQMEQKLSQMQQGMEMQMLQENFQDLLKIEDNLLKLSFNQEEIMKEFRKVNQSDPRFVELSQSQLKLKDDSQVIEDSLLSLAKRVFQISSFVTRELGEMNKYMDESVEALKERNKNEAVGKQQFAMTSINNLALLLNDVMQQMQQQMADAMGNPQQSKGKQQMPSLGDLQKQLNQKIEDLKKSGKSGRQLSEELAKLAAEQEMIREALQEQQQQAGEKRNEKSKGGSQDAIEKMEETELDLVNKQLTQRMIERQKDILSRLLEAENAQREREMKEEREGETARQQDREVPPAFKEYIKAKEQEIELLKTVPPKLNPYYKNQVSEFFKRLNN
ncbi:MAG: DUF4175 family protein [Cyclobacteriaceae bacterium]